MFLCEKRRRFVYLDLDLDLDLDQSFQSVNGHFYCWMVKGSVKVILLGCEDGLERWAPAVSLGMDLRISFF
jgi:hypothetical protein